MMKSVFLIVGVGGVVMLAALVGQPPKTSQITQIVKAVEQRLDKIYTTELSSDNISDTVDGLRFGQAGLFDPSGINGGNEPQDLAASVILRDSIRIPVRPEVRHPYQPTW
jgi:hypothetical protein